MRSMNSSTPKLVDILNDFGDLLVSGHLSELCQAIFPKCR